MSSGMGVLDFAVCFFCAAFARDVKQDKYWEGGIQRSRGCFGNVSESREEKKRNETSVVKVKGKGKGKGVGGNM